MLKTRDASQSTGLLHWSSRLRLWTVVLFGLCSLGLPLVILLQHGLSGDVWWTWGAGRWMGQHGRILLHEPASWTGPLLQGRPWINLEWLWQLVLYSAIPHLSPVGIVVFFVAAELLMMATFFWAMRAMAPTLPVELVSFLYMIYAAFFFIVTVRLRAELFSYIAFPFLLGLLWRSRRNLKWLWIMAPLAVLWANMHGSWLMIPVLVGLEILLSLWERQWRGVAYLVGLGWVLPIGLVVAFTPEHLHTLTYAWWLDHNRNITSNVVEWQSVNFHVTQFAAMAVLVVGLWIWRARIPRVYPLILDIWFGGVTLAFFDQVRMVTYFGMVLALWLGYGWAQKDGRLIQTLRAHASHRGWGETAGVGLLLGLVVSLSLIPYARTHALRPPMPLAVISWMNHHPHQEVFNPEPLGGFLTVHHVRNIFMDGRADFYLYNSHRFQDYVHIVDSRSTPQEINREFLRNGVNRILWPQAHMSTSLAWFVTTYHWNRVYDKHHWVVYARPE